MGALLAGPRRRANKKNSAASVLTVEEDDDGSDDTAKSYPVASPVSPVVQEAIQQHPLSVRLSVKDHTPLENCELLKEVNPAVNETEFRNNLNTIRTLYDWENIPLDFFVDGMDSMSMPPTPPPRKQRNSVAAPMSPLQLQQQLHEQRASQRAAAGAAATSPPALPPPLKLPRSAQGADQQQHSMVPPQSPLPLGRAGGPEETMRARSKTIASTTVKNAKQADIVDLDTMYARPSDDFWQNNPIHAGTRRANDARPPPSPIAPKNLTPAEEKTYNLYVRKSLVVGPDGMPLGRPSVVEARRRSTASTRITASNGGSDPEMLLGLPGRNSAAEARRRSNVRRASVDGPPKERVVIDTMYSDARRPSIKEVSVPEVDYEEERARAPTPDL